MTSGTILVQKDALRPPCFQLKDEALPNGWMAVAHNLSPSEFEKELSDSGWTFFYIANSIKTTSLGWNRAKGIQSALKRLIANVKQQGCNSLEIDAVSQRSFFGVPYVSVSAHPRHIQKGIVFSGQ